MPASTSGTVSNKQKGQPIISKIRSFSHVKEEWNFDPNLFERGVVDAVEISIENGDSLSEFSIRWHNLAGIYIPRLEVYEDAWAALVDEKNLLSLLKLKDDTTIQPDYFCKCLAALGYKDMTQRTSPNPPRLYRVTTNEPGGECCDETSETEIVNTLPSWAQTYRSVILDPEFLRIAITFETSELKIEVVRE